MEPCTIFRNILKKTSKSDQTPFNIRKEKFILAPIWACQALIWANFFLGFSSTRSQTLFPILRKTNDANLRKLEFYLYLLDIVSSYDPIQFKGILKNQTCENGKNPNFGFNFGPFGPNYGLKHFLEIVPSYHAM